MVLTPDTLHSATPARALKFGLRRIPAPVQVRFAAMSLSNGLQRELAPSLRSSPVRSLGRQASPPYPLLQGSPPCSLPPQEPRMPWLPMPAVRSPPQGMEAQTARSRYTQPGDANPRSVQEKEHDQRDQVPVPDLRAPADAPDHPQTKQVGECPGVICRGLHKPESAVGDFYVAGNSPHRGCREAQFHTWSPPIQSTALA